MSDVRGEALRARFSDDAANPNRSPALRPKDAATLVIVDRSARQAKVLMGRRHHGLKFMAGKFVFPGGRLEPDDRRMPAASELDARVAEALAARTVGSSVKRGRALAMTAIRETCEETGLLLGRKVGAMPPGPSDGAWAPFYERNILPDLGAFTLIGRAITPPGRPKRFDTRFFAVDRTAICEEIGGIIGPDAELVELVWVDLKEARSLDLPAITQIMLDELQDRTEAGFGHDLPVPFYSMVRKARSRVLV